ncbi:hypothetical protein RCC89_20455 [Cytophagaceae bacterium ABcell3]|nr:hypothetical protein RCC89_20455 [Cytophagaceae bacterium ABcell3]
MRVFICFLLFKCYFFAAPVAYAQEDSEDVSALFDDGGFSNSKNVIKFNILSVYVGDIAFFYERAFGDKFSIEIGGGPLMNYYNPEFFGLYAGMDAPEIVDPSGGYSIWVNPRIYFHGAPLNLYTGIQYRRRHYFQTSANDIIFNDIAYNAGVQLDIWGRVILDYNVGVGVRLFEPENQFSARSLGSHFILPITLKLGYLF